MLIAHSLIHTFFLTYTVMLFVRILSSWIPELAQYQITQIVFQLTDPYLNIFRRLIPPFGMIDFSPVIAFFALGFLERWFHWILEAFFG